MQQNPIHTPISIKIFAFVLLLFALTLLIGGVYLVTLGGSWYYLISGVVLCASSIFLFKNSKTGVHLFWLFFVYTFIWTIWEAGSRYWGWVPRLATVAVFAFFLSILMPKVGTGIRKKVAYSLTGVIILCFVVAGALAFYPHNSYISEQALPNQPLTSQISAHTSQADADWQYYGRDEHATRYSPLNQITPENVKNLEVAWTYRTGDVPKGDQENKWAAETTPIKVGNAMYLCSATNNIIKLDAATGQKIWEHKSGVKYESIPYTAACKGVTYYQSPNIAQGQPCHEKLIVGTLDMRLLAVDAQTGQSCAGFGQNGQVDLSKGMGKWVPGQLAVTAPVPIVNGVVVVNHQVLDGQRRWAPSGVIRGYDADTGAFKWAWDVNRPGEHGEPAAGEQYSRGTPNSWAAMIGDEKLGLVYVPTGNSAVDYYSAMRTADENRVSSAVVALDVQTGAEKWVFQTVHKDVWDYDIGSQPTLVDFPNAAGVSTPALIMPTKRGQTFVLDRATGKALTQVEERPAPQGKIPNDPRAATQPWSTEIPRLGFSDLSEKTMWGVTPIDQMMCRIKFKQANYVGEFTPPSLGKSWIEYPGYNGGSDWGSVAFDPNRGVMIANWNNTPMYDRLITREEANAQGLKSIDDPDYQAGGGGAEGNGAQADTPYGINVSPFYAPITQVLCNEPPYGMITAIDMRSKKVLWQHPLGSAEQNGPFGLPTYMPINIGTPNNGGPIITAGGLTFVAAATDNKLHAIDNRTGKLVWTDKLPAGGQATPMTYSVNGEQYVVIMAGGHHFMMTPVGDYVIAYKLKK
ncbi:MAG: membrane-bound PQQ-dependent dehydrogenase, glucose/quinate/shikimate family [Pseudomonadota bacterium]|nr:membrane-bound PQQ-dependent dehydrogenase, glucose/quinate/shikimate family [Pseudomonadota bacterium]